LEPCLLSPRRPLLRPRDIVISSSIHTYVHTSVGVYVLYVYNNFHCAYHKSKYFSMCILGTLGQHPFAFVFCGCIVGQDLVAVMHAL